MTRFNPEKNNKTALEWSEVALKTTQENHLQWNVIGGIVLGALAASTASPITGGLIVGYFLWDSWKKAGEIQRTQAAIAELGCVAQVLDGDDFADYARQVGNEAVIEELKFASERGLALSDAAADFYDDNAATIPKTLPDTTSPLMATAKTLLEKAGLQPQIQTIANTYNPIAALQIDIISEISDRITNTFIIGIPGSGKGMLVSNAIRQAKRSYGSALKVFAIDPKNDPKEAGYYDCCDYVERFNCMDAKPKTVAAFIEESFKKYDSIKLEDGELCLLVLDEGTLVGGKLALIKAEDIIRDKIIGLTSSGDSRGRNIWYISQTPYVGASGLNLSSSSQMTTIVIASQENLGAIEQWKRASIFKKLDVNEVAELVANSPCHRAIYHGKKAQWFAMPQLKNYSGYNRDLREYLPGFEPQTREKMVDTIEAISELTDSLNNSDNLEVVEPELELKEEAEEEEASGFDFNKAIEILRTFKGKDWMKLGDARAKCKPLRKVTRDADDVRLLVSFLQKDGEADLKDGDLFLILDKPS